MRFSANLGFLYTDRPLLQAVADAAADGFDAVECHFPYDTPPAELRAACTAAGLPLVGLNTRPGNAGEFGLAALPDRIPEARAAIREAVDYAAEAGAGAVHVMAGLTDGGTAAEAAYRDNLAFACDAARPAGLKILIEPINRFDIPDYHLHDLAHADGVIAALGAPELGLMFDCYHAGRAGLDVPAELAARRPGLGHVQIAAVPERGAPDPGEVDYPAALAALAASGYPGAVGAEYRPDGPGAGQTRWLAPLRAAATNE